MNEADSIAANLRCRCLVKLISLLAQRVWRFGDLLQDTELLHSSLYGLDFCSHPVGVGVDMMRDVVSHCSLPALSNPLASSP